MQLVAPVRPSGTAYTVTLPSGTKDIEIGSLSVYGKKDTTCTNLRNGDLSPAGVTVANDCNRSMPVSGIPGEIKFFFRPLTVSEKLSNGWAGAFNG